MWYHPADPYEIVCKPSEFKVDKFQFEPQSRQDLKAWHIIWPRILMRNCSDVFEYFVFDPRSDLFSISVSPLCELFSGYAMGE